MNQTKLHEQQRAQTIALNGQSLLSKVAPGGLTQRSIGVRNYSAPSERRAHYSSNAPQQDFLLGQLGNEHLPGSLLNSAMSTKGVLNVAPAHEDSNGFFVHDCQEFTTSSMTSSNQCNTSSSQLLLMNIPIEELNFSDIKEVWLVKSWQEILLRVSFVAPIVLLGLIGNLTIIYSMCRFKPIRSKPTNIFIANMALADLITSIVCPNAALLTDIYQFYVLGYFICRTEGFIKITCLLVSAYSLIVLSFDWFLCVVRPCRKRITIRQSWLTLVSIWIVSIGMAMPLLYWRNLRERRWKDLVEVWCCEHIQYTKYYWVCITLFLIYFPTFIMTIVLVVILVQMDKFEAKLRRSRQDSSTEIRNDLSHIVATSSGTHLGTTGAPSGSSGLNSSLSINMKYRRRIVKILFFYLFTSIVCWTPLQFVIVYRHFRTEAVPANWFFELAFFSQLCASLSAAMNPIIFGFLSQPFRRVVTKSWMFRFLDKIWTTNTRNRSDNGKNDRLVMNNRRMNNNNNNNNQANPIAVINLNGARSSQRLTRDLEQPKLTIDYIEHDLQQVSGRAPDGASSSKRTSVVSSNHSHRYRTHGNHHHRQHNHQHNHDHNHQHHHQQRHHHHHHYNHHHQHQHQDHAQDHSNGHQTDKSNFESFSRSNANSSARSKINRSHSSRLPKGLTGSSEQSSVNKRVSFDKRHASVRMLTNSSSSTGRENEAYNRDDELDDDDGANRVPREHFSRPEEGQPVKVGPADGATLDCGAQK